MIDQIKYLENKNKAPKIPVRDFFRNPKTSSFQLSPSGEYISYMKPYKNRMNVFFVKKNQLEGGDLESSSQITGEVTQLTFVEERDIAGYFWKGDKTIVYVKDFGGDENYHLFSVNVETKQEIDLTPFDDIQAQIIDGLEELEDQLIIGLNKENKQVHDAYRVNIITGDLKLIAKNPGNITGWLTDHTGQIRMANVTDGVNTSWLYRDSENEDFETMITTNFKETLSPLFFTFDNNDLYVTSNIGRDKSAIFKYNPKSKKTLDLIFEHDEVDVSSLTYSKKEKALISIVYTTDKTHRKFINDSWKKMYEYLKSQIPNQEISIYSLTKDEKQFLFSTHTDRSLGAIYHFDRATKIITKMINRGDWLNPEHLSPMIPFNYEARDGLKIPGYLSFPIGVELKNLPMVVLPHGGPWARDTWGYRPDVQFLTNRGYVVLQMNFRGSVGFGREFWQKSFKQWGKTMQDDITDAVNYVVDLGLVDKERIGIYGASYGGYAVLAGLTFTPELYKCGIDYVGVSNIFTLLETLPPYWEPMLEMMYEMVGHPVDDKDLLVAASPVFHVDKIIAPLLIAQGAKDPRVKKSESDQMVEALKKRGIDVPYIVKENEGHGFQNEENRFELFEKIETFLEKYLS
ncbi:MAG: S9 family peptidase [Candidatus Cloacimonadota bacterium]|nr:MAG: S9 family peptidase [Candidatus Cloacimonadota bacterium]